MELNFCMVARPTLLNNQKKKKNLFFFKKNTKLKFINARFYFLHYFISFSLINKGVLKAEQKNKKGFSVDHLFSKNFICKKSKRSEFILSMIANKK